MNSAGTGKCMIMKPMTKSGHEIIRDQKVRAHDSIRACKIISAQKLPAESMSLQESTERAPATERDPSPANAICVRRLERTNKTAPGGVKEKNKTSREMNGRGDGEGGKGLIWKLPAVKSKRLGKLGPAFGFGAGCGVGFGLGLMGGAGIGPGIPGLQLGFGVGIGCGVGVGFGYGAGRGIAHDESRRYSNVGSLFHTPADFPTQDEIGALFDDLISNTRKLIKATSREIGKWRRDE